MSTERNELSKQTSGAQNKSTSVAKLSASAGKAVGRRATRNVKISTVRKKEKTPFPTSLVFTCIMITVVVLYTIINYAEINNMENDIASLRSNVTSLQKSEAKLQNQLNLRYSEADIERVAEEELGMVKSSELERKYVDLTKDDKTEIVDHGNDSGFAFLLSSFSEALKELFD